ncbi:polysaccharide pyruvyl transferase family protein [Anaerotruncus colihominis]|uniref:Polysaccharide pyruvyl transferase family protein n=1 Tax=Anaerotruncus colihominis TaxID=169435 RepID=A0A845RJ61_9FIRM|nr:polysaccharide pyruvyl transferase family protein [Anaerotruncus colihominis]NBI80110.1 polysaccharide pyruvyl transferase family protein [Anaerotruncus colihominis]
MNELKKDTNDQLKEYRPKVATMTFHTHHNYGALLQCYALQQVLTELGAEAEVIDYKCIYDRKPYRLQALRKKGFIKYLFGILGPITRIPRYQKCKLFRERFRLSQPVNKDNIHLLADSYDLYLAGSDNIWNNEITDLDQNYFLSFVEKSDKKGSYAASFGFGEIPAFLYAKYKKLLSGFRYYCMREQRGVDIIEELLEKTATEVLDPTMLLDISKWTEIITPVKKNDPYIFAYQMAPSKKFVKFVKDLSKQTGFKVIYTQFPMGGFLSCKLSLTDGPCEWLGLIKQASYIVTDSFHGTVFSILFHKPFFSVVTQLGTRIENLLVNFGLKDRIFRNEASAKIFDPIPYEQVDIKLKRERERCRDILKQMLMECNHDL